MLIKQKNSSIASRLPFFHSFSQSLLSTFSVSGTLLGARDTLMNKTQKLPALTDLHSSAVVFKLTDRDLRQEIHGSL